MPLKLQAPKRPALIPVARALWMRKLQFWPTPELMFMAKALVTSASSSQTRRTPPSACLTALLQSATGRVKRGQSEKDWILAHRGEVLEWFRDLLPNQPPPALARPETRTGPWTPVYAAEAFAGGGLLSLAAFIEGISIVDVCEMAPWALKTLAKNGGVEQAKRLRGDRFLVDSKDAATWTPYIPPTSVPAVKNGGGLDLLMGGPPCQALSQGASAGGAPVIGPASEKNMFPRVIDWIVDSQPRVVVMENAATIVTREQYSRWMDGWSEQVKAVGYEVVIWHLYAPNYGTPQNRERAFVICFPKGAPWGEVLRVPPPPTHEPPGTAATDVALTHGRDRSDHYRLPWVSAFERLHSGCCGGYGLAGCKFIGNYDAQCRTCHDGENFEAAPNQSGLQGRRVPSASVIDSMKGNWVDTETGRQTPRLKKFRPTPASLQSAYQWKHASAPALQYVAPTILADAGTKRAQQSLLTPFGASGRTTTLDLRDPVEVAAFVRQLRTLSVREAAKLQDVPNWYKFEGGRTAAYRQVGNGIPVNLGRAVLRHVRLALGRVNPASDYGMIPVEARDLKKTGLVQTPPGWTVNNGLWPSGNPWPFVYNGPCAPYTDLPLTRYGRPAWDRANTMPRRILQKVADKIESLTWIQRAGRPTRQEALARQEMRKASQQSRSQRQALEASQKTQRVERERLEFWGSDGRPDHAKILTRWTPGTRSELPPGYRDWAEVKRWASGSRVPAPIRAAYRKLFRRPNPYGRRISPHPVRTWDRATGKITKIEG